MLGHCHTMAWQPLQRQQAPPSCSPPTVLYVWGRLAFFAEPPTPQLQLKEDAPTGPCTSPPKEAISRIFTWDLCSGEQPVQEAPDSSEVGDPGLHASGLSEDPSHLTSPSEPNRNTSLPVDHPGCHTHVCTLCSATQPSCSPLCTSDCSPSDKFCPGFFQARTLEQAKHFQLCWV